MFDDFLDMDDPREEEGFAAALPRLMPPREATFCMGQETVENLLLELAQSSRMPHALIFAGPKGIGKATMAFRLARYLFQGKGTITTAEQGTGLFGEEELPEDTPVSRTFDMSAETPVFRKIAAGGHPDLLTVERRTDEKKDRVKDAIDIEAVRKAAPFLRMTASEGGWRIVIVDDADRMNRNAQNALLKILEEPPDNALLILIAHRPGALIPTIRSRCRMVPFRPLSQDVLRDLLQREYPAGGGEDGGTAPQELDIVAAMAEGSIGTALEMMEAGGLESVLEILSLLDDWPKLNWPKIHQSADMLARPGQDNAFRSACDILLRTVEILTLACARGQERLDPPLCRPGLQALLRHYSLEQWPGICENLKNHFTSVQTANLDKRQGLLGAFALLERGE